MRYKLSKYSPYKILLYTNNGSESVTFSNDSPNTLILKNSEDIISELDNDGQKLTVTMNLESPDGPS